MSRAISRRQLLEAASFGAAAVVLSACGTSTPSAPPPTQTVTPQPSSPPASPSATATPAASPTATAGPSPVPLRDRIARLLIVGFRGFRLADAADIRTAIERDHVGGVILFDRDQLTGKPRNVQSPDQVRALVRELQAAAGPERDLIVAIDQEGGIVTRLSPKYGYPAVASEASIGEQPASAVEAWATGLVKTLADAGINLNFAPVVDLNSNPRNPAIGALDRAFSALPDVVSRDAAIEVRAHRAKRVRTALKHFPGIGSATVNTDFGIADVTHTWKDVELDPYRSLLKDGLVDVVMAAHIVNAQIDAAAVPASLSAITITNLLRQQLGWDGPVVTDDLQAAAITQQFGFDDAVELALQAGNDLLLFANQQVYDPNLTKRVVDLVEGLVSSGRLSEAQIDRSVGRVNQLFATG